MATIRPRRAQFLWIPAPANKTAAGVPRLTPRQFLRRPTAAILINKDRTGGIAGYRRRGQRRIHRTMFFLTKQVTLPGPRTTGGQSRLGFFDTWEKLAPGRRRRYRRATARAIRRARSQS